MTEKYLDLLLGSVSTPATWLALSDQKKAPPKELHGPWEDVQERLKAYNQDGFGIFIAVQETDLRGRKKDNVRALRALFVDADDGPLPDVLPVAPHMRVRTPAGEHVYWLLAPGEPLGDYSDAQRVLATRLGTDPHVVDLPRVLRVPGLNHHKAEPRPVILAHIDSELPRYTIKQVLQGFNAVTSEYRKTLAKHLLEKAITRIRNAQSGGRNNTLNAAVFSLKEFVNDGTLEYASTVEAVRGAAEAAGLSPSEVDPTLQSALSAQTPSRAATALQTLSVPAEAAASVVFESNSEEDIASGILRGWGAPELVRVVDGVLYRYLDGVWEAFHERELRAEVAEYHGAVYITQNGNPGNVAMTRGRRDAVVSSLLHRRNIMDDETFRDAPPGVTFENGYLAPTEAGWTLYEPHPDLRCRVRMDFPWDPDAECPGWLELLASFWENHVEEKMALIQEFIGVSLLGIAPQMQRAVLLYGSGSNGKSVLMHCVMSLFPQRYLAASTPQSWHREYYVAQLMDKLLNAVPEIPHDQISDAATFKAVVTGDPVAGRQPYGMPFYFRPRAGHLFGANRLPSTRDFTEGFWRRFIVVPMDRRFGAGGSYEALRDRFRGEEPGVVGWALRGAARAVARGGYTIPGDHDAAFAEWRKDVDSVAAFLDECCEVVGEDTPKAEWMTVAKAYGEFKTWAFQHGRSQVSSRIFARRCADLVGRVRTGAGYCLRIRLRREG